MNVPDDVREAIIDGLVKSATEARDVINEIRGIKIDRPVSRAIFQKDADYILSALEAAGWVCVPVNATVEIINSGDGMVALNWSAMLTASRHKEKQDG